MLIHSQKKIKTRRSAVIKNKKANCENNKEKKTIWGPCRSYSKYSDKKVKQTVKANDNIIKKIADNWSKIKEIKKKKFKS